MSSLIALVVLIALVGLGGWASRAQSAKQRLALAAIVPTVLGGVTLLTMIDPIYTWDERIGLSAAVGIMTLSVLAVVLNRWVWKRPWVLLVLLPTALFFGFVLAVNIGEQFGMPH